ncbi:MAG: ferritin family protein [Deltaproteobacteria bacterium]|nr:ferritin family protein [Deltaproteobacteria bacterium]MBW1927677.1 ferritin family protein [Deltaproteobacteria bacterium]MBW2026332.1 ferritin family protein [Deltaproteobacteria bacterium]MBW2127022.1 ferritin family protein [Deltaproteobacteria bacterium]
MFTLHEVIDLAIKIEENGERVYRKAAENMDQRPLQDLVLRLAEDEVKHIEWFSNLLEESRKVLKDPSLHEMGQKILNAILGEQSFSLGEADLTAMKGPKAILETALEFERDTVLFYEMLLGAVDEDALPYLTKIIEEENRHIRDLEASLKGLSS